jgi:hypothetical protein
MKGSTLKPCNPHYPVMRSANGRGIHFGIRTDSLTVLAGVARRNAPTVSYGFGETRVAAVALLTFTTLSG